ncbi:fluoride efflux transporter CrcB [Nocardia uniformis]|uniref:Fluoride-specific ion channel FluC n=1 Tax=Nocardia uniformis TaxID=53432 RepID=A0A849BTQ1_9NOCA|nr:fluoride efflux transporter CrcB [Nocardia uniformis]NNH69514.1 fluoride efflux transporter CrcB [Nocardia uniformis]
MGSRLGGADTPVLVAIALGGGVGAALRYGVSVWLPQVGAIPWQTLAVNVIGCFGIGALMVCINEMWAAHRLVRPFLGVGVLGGFTTFSTFAVEVRTLLESGRTVAAFGYLGGTVMASLGAVIVGVGMTRWLLGTGSGTRKGGRR